MIKQDAGTWTLGGINSHTGATQVSAGTLIVNGELTSTSSVTVAAGATLGGGGIINGVTTITGNLSPGSSPGVLAFGSDLTLQGASTTTMEIFGTTRGTEYDGVDIGGNLTYGGDLVIDFGNTFGVGDYSFDLFNLLGGQSQVSGSFNSVTLAGSYAGALLQDNFGLWSLEQDLNSWSFSQDTGVLSFSVVPEPSKSMLLVLALGSLLLRRRR